MGTEPTLLALGKDAPSGITVDHTGGRVGTDARVATTHAFMACAGHRDFALFIDLGASIDIMPVP